MKLYHAGRDEIREPDIYRGRKNADFGQGFYLTPDREFAYRWAYEDYVVNEYDELPVACLVAEHNQLFSDTAGIMVQGLNVPADEEFPYHSANYWWASERRANLSLFELDGCYLLATSAKCTTICLT